jgi:hypothetical protein
MKKCPILSIGENDYAECIGEQCQLWHFCSGETLREIAAAIDRMAERVDIRLYDLSLSKEK